MSTEDADLDECTMRGLIDTPVYTPITFTFQNVTVYHTLRRFPTKKQRLLMENVSGFVLPGQILSILGTKRTGKSLLLAVLGHIQKAKNHFQCIKINGKPIDKAFYHITGYVPTENNFVPHFTIRETLLYSCLLRLPRHHSLKDRFKVVDCMLKQVNLYEIRNQPIYTLKREERKLLALALEIANNPSVLLLDDPTVNLDYITANLILKLLQRLAKAGKTIILTSLNPKPFEFEYFSNILLMYKDERGVAKQAYFGNASYIQTYFSLNHKFISFNDPWFPTLQDYLNARRQNLDHIKEAFSRELEPILEEQIKIIEASPQCTLPYDKFSYYSANFWIRLTVLFLRHWIGSYRNTTFFWVRVVQIISLILIVVPTFWQLGYDSQADITKRFSALYFIVVSVSFVAIFAAMFTFTEDMNAMMRERFSKLYGAGSFLLGKVIADFASNLPFTLFFAILIYWIVGFNPSADRFFVFLLIIVSFVFVAQSLGEFIASWAPVFALSQALLPLAASLFLIYSNVTIPITIIPSYISWLYWISHFHYAIEALLFNEFEGLVFYINGSTTPLYGEQILEQRGIGVLTIAISNKWGDILMLVLLGICFRLLAYLGLRLVKKPNRVLPSKLERWCDEF